tara:strand:+ start:75 stop:293 length:219 start_codon:yes stop_codon:yes gene_type:complete
MNKFFLIVLALFFYCSNSYAYLDPGTGGIILQAIFGLIAGIITFYYILKQKIKYFFKKIINIISGKNAKSKD